MKKYTVLAALFIASLLTLAGCKSSQPAAAPATGSSQNSAPPSTSTGTLNSDGTVNPPGQQPPSQQGSQPGTQSGSQPVGQLQPGPPPAPVTITAPIGTRIAIRTTETLSAGRNEVGDSFTGVLDAPIVARGATFFPRGTRVTGTVIASKGRGRFKGSGALGIELKTIAGIRVETNEYEQELKGKGKRTGAIIGGGTGLGALIGGLAGGGKGAVIGGLAGAGAGTAGAAYTGNKDIVIPSESLVTFHLAAPLTIKR